jgi:hypothetical protein
MTARWAVHDMRLAYLVAENTATVAEIAEAGQNAAHELDQLAPDAFRRWLDLAQGRRGARQ